MAKTSGAMALTAAAAAAAGCQLLAPSALGFATGALRGSASAAEAVTMQRGVTSMPTAASASLTSGLVACAGAAVAAAGVSAVASRRSGRRAGTQAGGSAAVVARATADGEFAGGLVGSEYHGWGTYKWDPLEISSRYPDHLPWYREAELKHGRVAMLAFLGLVVPDFVRIPLDDFKSDELDFVNAHNKLIYGLGQGPMWWLLVFCAVIESLRFRELGLDFGKLTLENAGDLNFGKGFLPKSEEGRVQMKIKELKNGRLAMLAVSGILTQGVLFNAHHFPFA